MPSQLRAMCFVRGEEIATNEQMSVSEMHSPAEEMGTVWRERVGWRFNAI